MKVRATVNADRQEKGLGLANAIASPCAVQSLNISYLLLLGAFDRISLFARLDTLPSSPIFTVAVKGSWACFRLARGYE